MWKLLYTYDKIINEYNKSAWKNCADVFKVLVNRRVETRWNTMRNFSR